MSKSGNGQNFGCLIVFAAFVGYCLGGGCSDKEETSRTVRRLESYALGDYKSFLCDHGNKGKYLKWAPPLLSAEDYHRMNGEKFHFSFRDA
mgnify:CR=1 FL=1